MTTMGIKPGDAVLVIEHRGEQQLVYNALVLSFSMDESRKGARGEPAIQAVFVEPHAACRGALRALDAVHLSHRDFVERRALGYEELPDEEVLTILRLMLEEPALPLDRTKNAMRMLRSVWGRMRGAA